MPVPLTAAAKLIEEALEVIDTVPEEVMVAPVLVIAPVPEIVMLPVAAIVPVGATELPPEIVRVVPAVNAPAPA
jgi:hypothetical protein